MRVVRLIAITTVMILSIAIVFSAANAAGERGAKSLFYDPNAAGTVQVNPGGQPGGSFPSSVKSSGNANPVSNYYDNLNPGVMYWIELVRPGGGVTRVSNDRVFRTGDQIRIHVTTNSDGYLNVLHKGSTGTGSIIPVSHPNGEVRMGNDYIIPQGGGWMRFDNNPGQEKLTLVFASVKSSEDVLNTMRSSISDQIVAISSKYVNSSYRMTYTESGSKDLLMVSGQHGNGVTSAPPVQPVQYAGLPAATSFNTGGSSNFNVDPAVYNAPASYVVNTARGATKEPVVIEITLNHHP